MEKLIIIDDENCKEELDEFIDVNKDSIKNCLNIDESAMNVPIINCVECLHRAQKRIALNTNDGIMVFNISDVIRVESERNYTYLYLSSTEKELITKSLKDLEGLLDKRSFVRVHNSHLLNVDYIEKYERGTKGQIKLVNGERIPVSTRRRNVVLKVLKEL